jgi:hypothetical protein
LTKKDQLKQKNNAKDIAQTVNSTASVNSNVYVDVGGNDDDDLFAGLDNNVEAVNLPYDKIEIKNLCKLERDHYPNEKNMSLYLKWQWEKGV